MSESSRQHVAHHNLTILTTKDVVTMESFLSRGEIRALIWKRLDDTHALVDPTRVQLLTSHLKELGHVPTWTRSVSGEFIEDE